MRRLNAIIAAAVLVAVAIPTQGATISVVSENFNGIGTTATAALPAGWKAGKSSTARTVTSYASGGTQTEQVAGNSMATNASQGIYNYGAGAASSAADRAVGFLSSGSGTNSGNLFFELADIGVNPLLSLDISYNVEKYRGGSNANGFRIQLYVSTDGTNWTSAGSNFLTSFAADANNNGFASAPGVTVSVSNKTLAFADVGMTVGAHSSLYLAWNYSVTSGSTPTNAQGLGIDNVVITGLTQDPPPAIPVPAAITAGPVLMLGLAAFRTARKRRTVARG